MRKLILSEWVSLDGYVSDKKGQLDFFASLVRSTYAEPEQVKFLENIDTILYGRKTYEQFVTLWPDRPTEKEVLAKVINGSRKIVFSNTLKEAPWGKWSKAEISSGDAISHVKQLKLVSGKDIYLWASISIAQAMMKEKLFTEEINPANLKLIAVSHYNSGVVSLNYQPA